MLTRHRPLRGAAALLLAAALALSPLPARSQVTGPASSASPESAFGVAMAVICGASANIASKEPIPVVAAVGLFCCVMMYFDAMNTAD